MLINFHERWYKVVFEDTDELVALSETRLHRWSSSDFRGITNFPEEKNQNGGWVIKLIRKEAEQPER